MDLSLGTSALRRKLVGCLWPDALFLEQHRNAITRNHRLLKQSLRTRNSRIAAIEMTDVI